MKEIIEKSKCCGCHACMNICPVNAISMKEDEKGFKYPFIDSNKCINCGSCKRVCPVINVTEYESKIKAYACYNNNLDERLNSSSGGIFILIAKEIIKKNGVVFGATFDENYNVIHCSVETEEELKQFMGSKYVQSTIGNSYKKAKKYLNDNRYVLFSGTPCQIEGLKSYLGKEYDKLYTQDIVCHGVPSPKVWQKYLAYQSNINNEKIKTVSFRNKDEGWASFGTKISFDTKTNIINHHDDLFMRAFLRNICLRDSCYNCSFKKKYRVSDITLADYWGIDNIRPDMNDNRGTSLVVVNSSKGNELFELIKNNIVYVETDLDIAIKYNSAMVKSVSHCKNEQEFMKNLDKMEFQKLINKFVPQNTIWSRIKGFVKKSCFLSRK